MLVFVLPSWYKTTYNPLNAVFFQEQAVALKKQGVSVVVIAPALISLKEIIKARKLDFGLRKNIHNEIEEYVYQIPRIPFFDRINYLMRTMIGKNLLKTAIKEQGLPDVSHVHSYKNGGLAIWLKKVFKVPYIITEHNSEFLRNKISIFHKQKAKESFCNSAANIAVSSVLATNLKRRFFRDFLVIPNIVDVAFFHPKKSEKSIYTFINVAHLNKNKNQAMLIRAFEKHHQAFPNTRLLILGGGEEEANLQALVSRLGLAESVRLFGYATREEVRAAMQSSDCFVLPSIVETFGVVLIEAMACGLPVLASKCGGPESIVTAQTGLLFENNETAMLEAMGAVLKQNYSSSKIRKHVEDTYSEAAVAKQIINVLKSA
ncbi:MAG: hypothetical protein CMP75_04330 [Flavobacteriales bacterium]|nr:hypothetical protein [Flavobacteriales bacterium]|tara:strand:- start:8552 stop:9676 length:1125 start_codon:yes stop_codon:yes gene_type:complete